MTSPEFTPRTYADLLALVEAASVAVPPTPQAQQTPAPPAGGTVAERAARTISTREADTYDERLVMETIQLVVLGKTADNKVKVFSRYHKTTSTIPSVGHMKFETLLQIAGAPARRFVRDDGGELPPGCFSFRDVKRAVAMLAGFRTITEGDEFGSGCWAGLSDDGKLHDSVVIVGNSEACDWNGDKTLRRIEQPLARGRLLDFDQKETNWYDFDQLSGFMEQAKDSAFRIQAMNDCNRLFQRWRWKNDFAEPAILTGLVFASWVQTLWEWRPMVSVTGPTKAGKSMLCHAVKGLFGHLGKSCSDQTAAGVRQLIHSSARIFLLDEFDAEDKQRAEQAKATLKMLRASGRGDSIVRGTASQKANEVNLRHIVWILGIQIGSDREADRNRFINAELLPPTEELKGKLAIPPAAELAELGQRMLASAIYCIHDARKLAMKIKDTSVAKVDLRIVESYSVPAAMLAVIQGRDEAEARGLLADMLLTMKQGEDDSNSDEQELIHDIFSSQILVNNNRDRFTVSHLLTDIIVKGDAFDAAETFRSGLDTNGIRIDRFTGKEGRGSVAGVPCLLVAYGSVQNHLLKNTKWGSMAVQQILKRIPGSFPTRRRVGGQNALAVAIPLEYVAERFLGLDLGIPTAGAGGQSEF